MDLSVILVNYKGPALLLDCIESIYRETTHVSFEIIVVDNFSEDESERIVLQKFPGVVWVAMTYNSGFARANNAGIKIANGNFILLLNSDTIILENAIEKTILLLEEHREISACGVQLLNIDGSSQISGATNVKGGLNNTLIPLPYLGSLVRYIGYKAGAKKPSIEKIEEMVYVDWIIGAFLLTKRNVIDKAGLLDEEFFMYSEEMEWCSRLQRSGKLCLFEGPKVIHLQGGSSNEFYNIMEKENSKGIWNRKGRQIILSNLLRIKKQFGNGWFLINLFLYIIEIPVFFFGLLFDKIFANKKEHYSWKSFFSYSANIMAQLKYTATIFRSKPFFYKIL